MVTSPTSPRNAQVKTRWQPRRRIRDGIADCSGVSRKTRERGQHTRWVGCGGILAVSPTSKKSGLGTLHERVNRIRDLVNLPRRLHRLCQSPKWDQLCSSMDVLEDTELATDFYL